MRCSYLFLCGFEVFVPPYAPLPMDTWKMNQMEIQWNPALQPPFLYDHLIITTTVFRSKRKKHWSFYYYDDDPVYMTINSRYYDQDVMVQ